VENKQKWNVFIVSLLILTAFILGTQANGIPKVWTSTISLSAKENTFPSLQSPTQSVQLFYSAYDKLLNNYVDPIKDTDELTYSAIRGMLVPLGDPYTRFMDPEEYKDFLEDTEGHFAGIGATLRTDYEPVIKEVQNDDLHCPRCGANVSDLKYYRLLIVNTIKNSPAEKIGLMPGDHITKIDEKSTLGMTTTVAAENIRGHLGTKVTLTIVRKGVEDPFEVTLTRANIEVDPLEYRLLDNSIGYLKISTFNEKTAVLFKKALNDFNVKNSKGMVIDLRSNPGGRFDICLEMAGMIMPNDKDVVVYLKDNRGKLIQQNKPADSKQIYNKPFVILVNGGSASASEILTGMCMDYNIATVIGEQTFGKALVQTVFPLGDRTMSLVVTTAHYYTPSHFDLNKKGLEPDFILQLNEGTKELNEYDNQAQRAIEILKEQINK